MSLTISEPVTTLLLGLFLVALSRWTRSLNARVTEAAGPRANR
jgi:hypothetical protein